MSKEYFVYQLRISDSPDPFYVGKGKGARPHMHWDEYISGCLDSTKIVNILKHRKIAKAVREEKQILVEYLCEGLTDIEASRIEVWCIHLYGRISLKDGPLTNIADGGMGGNTIADDDTFARWEAAMSEVNSRPSVKKKRSESAKLMWADEDKRTAILKNRPEKSESTLIIARKQQWSRAEEKWLLAGEFYDLWFLADKPNYNQLKKLVNNKYGKEYHLQTMVKFFIANEDPKLHPTWIEWVSETKGLQ